MNTIRRKCFCQRISLGCAFIQKLDKFFKNDNFQNRNPTFADMQTTPIILYILVCLIPFVLLFFGLRYIIKHDREVLRNNQESVERTVKTVLEKLGYPWTHKWLLPEEMEFVSIILGLIPGQHKVWARVRVSKKEIRVTIEYFWNTDATERNFAEMVAEAFRKLNIETTLQLSNSQPSREEIRGSEPRHKNEWDEAGPEE